MLLIKFKCDYADEFDVYGFMVVDNTVWESYVDRLTDEDFSDGMEFGFGTNEALTFLDKKDYLSTFKCSEISNKEFITLNKFFKGYLSSDLIQLKYGFIPLNEDKFDPIDDEQDE